MVVRAPGGPAAMEWIDVAPVAPGPGEVRVRHRAVGVNFIDVYYRSGLYSWPGSSLIPGAEAVGEVTELGPDVEGLRVGERVAYVTRFGAYCEERVLPARRLVKVPDGLADETVASVLLKGLTAQYLVNSSYRVERGDTVLVHAAAGGVGLILGQWLAALGATAIGTAGGPEKVAVARAHGYAHVVDYRNEDFVAAVDALTGGQGCAAVYDSVGADTWRGSLKCLRRRGMFVNFGQSSGMIAEFRLSDLAAHGSLSANRPVLFDYVEERTELVERAQDLFARLLDGTIRVRAPETHALTDAAMAHERLEGRLTTGSVVLTV
ncbi:quinone oxidoreductase [Ancylobacter sp. 6x-1]|uniref:Quinone oxidoreductase n=1 Tax=Ancylobacter crimeensis TaxID=2579147 RepID=A0ABT0DE79_9HYPH|nr:quinone oxidoreductase [Ancylobacter crimeensis]MCK0198246.1 quinone oxidoreductase [Ancylobacter crimeensis]